MRKLFLFLMISIFVIGCAQTSHSVMGTAIDPANVQAIEKNVTTADQITQKFGAPMNKAMTDGGEIWTYMYMDTQGTTGLTSTQVSGKQQKLDVMIKDGIVVNYTYNEGPIAMQGTGSWY